MFQQLFVDFPLCFFSTLLLLILVSSRLFHPLVSPTASTSELHISYIISHLVLFSTLALCFPQSPRSSLSSASLCFVSAPFFPTHLIFIHSCLLLTSSVFASFHPLLSSPPFACFSHLFSLLSSSHQLLFHLSWPTFLTARNEE